MKNIHQANHPAMNREINAFINDFFPGVFARPDGVKKWSPAADIIETETGFTVAIDLPGLTKEDIEIAYEERVLTVSGERKLAEKLESERHARKERRGGEFSRAFRLPSNIEIEKIEAAFENGVLNISIPKSESEIARKITIS